MKHTSTRRLVGLLMLIALLPLRPALGQDAFEFYERAQARFNAGELQEAVIEIKNALQADPTNLPAYTLLARIYLRVGAAAAASEAVNKARRMGADSALIWPLQAQAMLQLRQYEQVLKTVPERGFPPDVMGELLLARGHAHAALQQFKKAEQSYALAGEQAPSLPGPVVGMVRVALLQGKLDVAEARAVRGVQIAPESADVWAIRGDVDYVAGDALAALAAYDQALVLEPDHTEARLARAGIMLAQGRLEEVEPELQRLGELMPLEPRLSYLKALFKGKSGDTGGARAELARAKAQLDDLGEDAIRESPQLLMLAGIASVEAGQLERATGYLKRYINRVPQRTEARKLLAKVKLRQGSAKQAIQVLEDIHAQGDRDPEYLALLADAYTVEGRHDIASRYLEKALSLNPQASSLRSRFALSQVRSGNEAQGLANMAGEFAAAPQQRQSVGALLAAFYIERGEGREAMKVTRQLLAFQPANLTFLNLHGSALASIGDTTGARMTFEQAVAEDAAFVPAGVNLGKVLAAQGELDAAHAALQRTLRARPESVPVVVELARVSLRAGQPEEARRWLEKARGINPRSVPAALILVELHLAQGRAAEALNVAEEARAWAPDEQSLMDAVARAQLALGRRDIVISLYQRMSRGAGFNAPDQYLIARKQAAVSAFDDAIYSLDKGLKGDPGHEPSRTLLIELLGRTANLDRGLEEARALREAQPGSARAHRLEGEMLGRMARYDEALEALERAQGLEPSTLNLLTISQLLNASGERDRARETLQHWLREHPDDAMAEVALADSYLAQGENARARQHYEHVIASLGASAGLLNNLAHAMDRQGDPEALGVARKAHEAAPRNPGIADTLGWLLVRHGQAQEGLRYLREAHSRASADPEIRYHIAVALAALGRSQEALKQVKAALRVSGSFAEASEARALMKRLGP